jgi:S-adenosylmethionine-dependent methyltransferase
VIAELAANVGPGGFLAAAVRTTTSALWRPAARQDCQAALAAFDEHDRALAEGRDMRYTNEIGAPARADELAALLDVEECLGATGPYRQLGQLTHLILRKANTATDDSN